MSAVSEVMSSRKLVSASEKGAPSASDVAKLMLKNKIGSVVIRNSKGIPTGIVTERDILRAASKSGLPLADINTSEIVSAPVITIRAFDSVESAASLMARKKIKRLVVVEQDGSIAGVISLTDITRRLAKILTDEHNRYSSLRSLLEI